MTRDEVKEIYEAIAAAMRALEADGEDLAMEDADDFSGGKMHGESFTIFYDDDETWKVKESS